MTRRRWGNGAGHRTSHRATHVGFFGILGSGNIGNDGSLESVTNYLAKRHPEARIGFFCMGPDRLARRYDAPAQSLQWYEAHANTATGVRAVLLKITGKLLDPLRTLAWVRDKDAVIVPGMGVLESTQPLRPWAMPYSLLALGVASKLTGTKVALVSVGANVISKPLTRWLVVQAARLADYRSYRDDASRDAMRQMGLDVGGDHVYPDLAFALPVPEVPDADDHAVGVGVMGYYGSNDDRARADEIHRDYVATMTGFVYWLLDQGRPVRILSGDNADTDVVDEILAAARAHRPDLDQSRLVVEPLTSLHDLLRQLATVEAVVATRYHNVVCALMLAKPTVSVGYATKIDIVMAESGLAAYCHSARQPDLDRLIAQFTDLERRAPELREAMTERSAAARRGVERQFAELSAELFTNHSSAEGA
ncbi:polysaccharide pyruvyl transferase family protein [Haloechinothrix halophila]|uniref:polysaccharide pyruvyl transferase family protein n=1 Tax=Haloechinothrix halophila TaxID=1069073 RepID=UPI00040C9F44|nr:polysaccharide pyruvyl transferase family protein [Haloechinothrix halophila]